MRGVLEWLSRLARSARVTTSFSLEQLPPDAARELVTHILRYADRAPEALVSRVVDEADGNPLHVEELIKIFIDDGVIVASGPMWEVDEERLLDHRVPDTLTGVLQARLDRLPPHQFKALQRASVFGRFFWRMPSPRWRGGRRQLGDRGLIDAELVFPRTPSRFQHTTELAFKHEFTRPSPTTRSRSPSAPSCTVARGLARPQQRLANWRARARDRPPLRRGRGPRGAFAWYERAARHSENQSAYDDAARLWGLAAERATMQQDRDRALVSLGYANVVAGDFEGARALLLGLRSNEPPDDPEAVATQMFVRAELARIAIFRDGELADARELLTEELEMAAGDETVRAELMLRHQLGNLAIWTGDFAEAIRIHEENVERAGEGAEYYRRGWGLNSLAFALTQSGELDRAVSVADRVIRAADELGDPRLRMAAIAQSGGVGGAYAAWRLMTGAVSPGSPIPQDPTERRIALVEWSDRIGGRLESLLPPWIENLRAEFGGMGYTSKDKLVNALVSYFDLKPVDFPHGGLSNLFYLRGERFTVKDANDPSFVPPYQLEVADKGIDPRKLIPSVIEKVFPGCSDCTPEQWKQATSNGYNGRDFNELGFWNFLEMNMTNEEFEYARDATGHTFEVANWNCAQALPWYMLDGNASYFTLTGGYDRLPLTLASTFTAAGGTTFMSTQVVSVQPVSGGQGFELVGALGDTCSATAVVLALPRRALELIDCSVLSDPSVEELIASVTGQPVLKIFCCYDQPWWIKPLGITAGSSATDLPLGGTSRNHPALGGSLRPRRKAARLGSARQVRSS